MRAIQRDLRKLRQQIHKADYQSKVILVTSKAEEMKWERESENDSSNTDYVLMRMYVE